MILSSVIAISMSVTQLQRCAPRYFLAAAVWTPKLVGGGGLTAVWQLDIQTAVCEDISLNCRIKGANFTKVTMYHVITINYEVRG